MRSSLSQGGHYWNDVPMLSSDLRYPCCLWESGDTVSEAKKKSKFFLYKVAFEKFRLIF